MAAFAEAILAFKYAVYQPTGQGKATRLTLKWVTGFCLELWNQAAVASVAAVLLDVNG
jgi:hypothetical protein